MIKQRFWYILIGILIAFSGMAFAISSLAPAWAGEMFIPFVTGDGAAIQRAASIEEPTQTSAADLSAHDSDSDTPQLNTPDDSPIQTPKSVEEPTQVSAEDLPAHDSGSDAPLLEAPDGSPMEAPKHEPDKDAAYFETEAAGIDFGGVPVTAAELIGQEFTAGDVEIRLPDTVWVEGIIMGITCDPRNNSSPCPHPPIYTITDGAYYVGIEVKTGKVFVHPQDRQEADEMERSFGFLREQVKPGDYLVIEKEASK